MRLWHESLLPYLPTKQLNGLHREISGMRGDGWNQNHSVVDYVWNYQRFDLHRFHQVVLDERDSRDFGYDERFRDPSFMNNKKGFLSDKDLIYKGQSAGSRHPVYPEHDKGYLRSCVLNLEDKGVDMSKARNKLNLGSGLNVRTSTHNKSN